MNRSRLRKILQDLADHELSVDDAMDALKVPPFQDLGYAKLDNHRPCVTTFRSNLLPRKPRRRWPSSLPICTKPSRMIAPGPRQKPTPLWPGWCPKPSMMSARMITVVNSPVSGLGTVAVITAGTADIPVAEEAARSLEVMGARVNRIFDVGVAGIHRLLDRISELNQAQVLVVVAGMDGALPSVVGGLTSRPVIAVPTSVGYGANFGGLSALLAMLNSCATGVGVVNIDNGFGAAALACAILNSR